MSICTHCALCCDGTLYTFVEVDLDERERVGIVAPGMDERDGRPILPQSCACLDGRLCGIYPARPRRCATYRCELLKAVVARTVSEARALDIIREARSVAGEVTADLSPGQSPASLRVALAKPVTERRELPAALTLNLFRLNLLLDRYFRSERARAVVEDMKD